MRGRRRWPGRGQIIPLALGIGAAVGTLTGCQGTDGPTSPAAQVRPPRFDVMDCSLDSQSCQAIQNSIDYLKNHWAEQCRQAGQSAQVTFDLPAGQGGFRAAPSNDNNFGMAVMMHQVPSGVTASGWAPDDSYIDVGRNFYAAAGDPIAVGALIAHEEEHVNGDDGLYHNTGAAQRAQDLCANPNGS